MRRGIYLAVLLASSLLTAGYAQEDTTSIDASDLRGAASVAGGSSISEEELAKSQALKDFLIKRHEEALEGFRALSVQYPLDVVPRRYIAACLAETGKLDEAKIELELILISHPDDLPSHKILSKLLLKQGRLAEARQHLDKLVEKDVPEGRFSAYAKSQIERLDTIASAGAVAASGQIEPADFMKSAAVVHFMDARYEESLSEFESLESQYPRDVKIKRYKGIAYDKLGRHDEAIRAFQSGLDIDPENAALRYALAQALFHKKDLDASAAELKKISSGAMISDYKVRADRDLEAIERIETIRTSIEKKWSFAIEQGFEFNSNAASEPTKRRVIDEEHAVRFPGSFYANYTAFRNDPWTLSVSYGYSHSLYSDTLDYLQTMAHAPTVTLMHAGEFAGRPAVTILSSTYVHLSVAEQFYYQSYPQSLRWIYSFADWHRMILSEKISWTDYKDQGSAPSSTSREGVSNALGMAHTLYHNKEHTLYTDWGYEFKAEDTDGSDYVRNVHQLSAGVTFPVWKDWSGGLSFRYKNSDYPETTRNVSREDNEYLIDGRVTIPMNETTSLKLYYDYLLNDSNDPFYHYTNHSGGASIAAYF